MAEEWTFEKAMTRLEQIVGVLESGRCTLDDSLKLFEVCRIRRSSCPWQSPDHP